MKHLSLILKIILLVGFVVFVGGCGDYSDEKVGDKALSGWAMRDSVDGFGTIIYTNDRGKNWVRQGSQSMITEP
jgi:hypothetical protein